MRHGGSLRRSPHTGRQPVRSKRPDRRWTLLVATPGLCDRYLDTVYR
jgi:hypothetical protein